jgi:hypothetical protein
MNADKANASQAEDNTFDQKSGAKSIGDRQGTTDDPLRRMVQHGLIGVHRRSSAAKNCFPPSRQHLAEKLTDISARPREAASRRVGTARAARQPFRSLISHPERRVGRSTKSTTSGKIRRVFPIDLIRHATAAWGTSRPPSELRHRASVAVIPTPDHFPLSPRPKLKEQRITSLLHQDYKLMPAA